MWFLYLHQGVHPKNLDQIGNHARPTPLVARCDPAPDSEAVIRTDTLTRRVQTRVCGMRTGMRTRASRNAFRTLELLLLSPCVLLVEHRTPATPIPDCCRGCGLIGRAGPACASQTPPVSQHGLGDGGRYSARCTRGGRAVARRCVRAPCVRAHTPYYPPHAARLRCVCVCMCGAVGCVR